MEVGSVAAVRVLLGQPVNSVPQVPLDPSAKVGHLCPVPLCPALLPLSRVSTCPSPQLAAVPRTAVAMTALGALAPASATKAGLGHAVKYSWVSSASACAPAAHARTPGPRPSCTRVGGRGSG